MRKVRAIVLVSAALAVFWFIVPRPQDKGTLSIYSSASLTKYLLPVAKQYTEEFGTIVDISEGEREASIDLLFSIEEESEFVKEVIHVSKLGEKFLNIAVLTTCKQPDKALKFARYLAAPDKGGIHLKEIGFQEFPGDKWATKPNLVLYSGGVNRPAVEKLLSDFKVREGIDLTTVFNGCGILCATMQTMTDSTNPRFPDAYFACDLCFVPPVAEHFSEVVLLTETDIGIAIPKENPHQIKTLTDLAKPGIKVGLCNQKQSTLGFMTGGILKSSGLEKSIRKNMAVEVPTADFLITQLRSGALDAAIVYRVNAEIQKEHLKFIRIKHEGARAVQPFSVRADSDKHQLASRLLDHFLANPQAFEETGFTWRGNEGAIKSTEIRIPEWLSGK